MNCYPGILAYHPSRSVNFITNAPTNIIYTEMITYYRGLFIDGSESTYPILLYLYSLNKLL